VLAALDLAFLKEIASQHSLPYFIPYWSRVSMGIKIPASFLQKGRGTQKHRGLYSGVFALEKSGQYFF